MRNLKKFMAVLLAVAMVVTAMVPVFADTAALSADATICKDLGMLEGADASGVTAEYVATAPSRIQAAVLFLRLKGLEDEAKAFTGTDNFADVAAGVWYAPITAYLKANPTLGYEGVADNKFDPDSKMSAQAYYKVVLTAMGYKQDVDFKWDEVFTFAASKGLSKVKDVTNYTINDLAIATVEGLKAVVKGSNDTLAAVLVADGAISAEKAEAAGVYTAPVVADLDVVKAFALTSKHVQVDLDTAAEAVDADLFTVKDADGKAIAVASAELAGWDSDKETVLVTLEDDTTAGVLYTLTTGDKSVKFGGKAVDEDEIEDIASKASDWKTLTVGFGEAIDFSEATVTISEKYGSKAELAVAGLAYGDDANTLEVTTDPVKKVLYEVTIVGLKDLSGNESDDIEFTFTGIPATDDDMQVVEAVADDSKSITVEFDQDVDEETATNPANYVIAEKYGAKAEIEVVSAEINDDDDFKVDLKLASDTKKSTMYVLTVSNVKSIYGNDLDEDEDEVTFAGKPVDDDMLEIDVIRTISNTEIEISFKDDQKAADDVAEDTTADMFSINAKYGDKAELAIESIEVDDNTVTITTASQKNVLYELTIKEGIKDANGNATDEDIEETFTGKKVADPVDTIVSAKIDANDATKLVVEFEVALNESAEDVSYYFIDKGVGYPINAELLEDEEDLVDYGFTADDSKKVVVLTIPETNEGSTYKLTITGLENADGVEMEEDEVTKTFAGKGETDGDPVIEAVEAVDAQTLKIYFDRDVTGSDVEGAGDFWIEDTNKLVADVFAMNEEGDDDADVDLEGLVEYAYQDETDDSVLIVRFNAPLFTGNDDEETFVLKVNAALVAVDEDSEEMAFAGNVDDPEFVVVEAVESTNNKTVRVHFNQAVTNVDAADFIVLPEGYDSVIADALAIDNVVEISDTIYDIILDTDEMETADYVLLVKRVNIKDVSGTVGFDPDSNDEDATYADELDFAGTDDAADLMEDISSQMLNNKTIEIHFPMPMDEDAVETEGNYTIHTDVDVAAEAINVAFAEYDEDGDDYFVTLYLDAALDEDVDNFYVKLNATNIKDITGVVGIETDDDANFIMVANDTEAASEPVLASAETVEDNVYAITVEFDKAVAFGAIAFDTDGNIAANEFDTDVDGVGFATTDVKANFVVEDSNGDAVAIDTAVRVSNTEVEITFEDVLTPGETYTVKIATTSTIKDMTGVNVETDEDDVSEIDVSIPN